MGLAPFLVKEIFKIIKDINRQGRTVLLVEQNAVMALKIAHRGYVLETGEIILAGRSGELLGNPVIQNALFGALKIIELFRYFKILLLSLINIIFYFIKRKGDCYHAGFYF